MHLFLIVVTAALCGIAFFYGYAKYRDVFHPLIYTAPMFLFVYAYLPFELVRSETLPFFLTTEQAVFSHSIVLLVVAAFILGCIKGSAKAAYPVTQWQLSPDPPAMLIRKGAYILGFLGLLGWVLTISNVGGFSYAYGQPYGGGWSDYGYLRDTFYLLLASLFLLLSPPGFDPKNLRWKLAVATFTLPWVVHGFLGARRGPTFIIFVTIAVAWHFARGTRPRLLVVVISGFILGAVLLFLVTHRSSIYLGSDLEIDLSSLSAVAAPSEANEYLFGSGCIITSHQSGRHYWGKRFLAYVLVRPIPRQIWPNKYLDFGVPEVELNAGVAGSGLEGVMGWREIPGAAAAIVADLWVEFAWGAVPVGFFLGWLFGYVWRQAVTWRGHWVIHYLNLTVLSIYLITQGVEPILYRSLLLAIPTMLVWRWAQRKASSRSPHVTTFSSL